ncbi:3-oxoacyl-(acyl-carrier-protein) reductase [Pelosinus sp. UFO1]|nr:3-oxoacyl-(acyl-carrier-protein) reductase [Pelosinus sp. UFO1]
MEVTFNFTGKRFVVTGASSGMGRQIAKELALAGADVLAIARRLPELEQLQAEFPKHITIASADVTDYSAIEQVVSTFVQEKGKLNGSVHAAGILTFTPLRAFDEVQAKKVMDISFWAGINLLKLITKKKYSMDSTSHVQFSSVSASRGQKGLSAYSATKAAIHAGVRSVAKELADRGHRLNVVSPGWVNTDMTKDTLTNDTIVNEHLLGIGTPEDVSGMVLFLLSNRARWITGADFVVDGGYLA